MDCASCTKKQMFKYNIYIYIQLILIFYNMICTFPLLSLLYIYIYILYTVSLKVNNINKILLCSLTIIILRKNMGNCSMLTYNNYPK